MKIQLTIISFLLAVSTGAFAQNLADKRVVNVEGMAQTFVEPDRSRVQLGVVTEGKDARKVKTDNNNSMRQLIAMLQKLGIEAKDIKTSTLRLEPEYDYSNHKRREFIKFTMRNIVSVTIRDLNKLDDLIALSVENGSNMLQDIQFSHSKAEMISDSLRIEAAKNAKVKAEQLATAIGSKLGKPLSISENGGYQPMMMKYEMRGSRADSEDAPTVSAGSIELRSTVSATFELE